MRWERLAGEEERQDYGGVGIPGPGKRWGHTCNAIKEGRFLYVFGGYGKHNCQTNQVHVFDTGLSLYSLFFYFPYFFLVSLQFLLILSFVSVSGELCHFVRDKRSENCFLGFVCFLPEFSATLILHCSCCWV